MANESPTKQTPPTQRESKTNSKDQVEYPNYSCWQTRAGNTPWFVSDTKGNEFMKCQHRSGTHWEMNAKGAFKLVASKNREDITFGKHVSYTTGSQDSTVVGDSSIRTEGSRHVTTVGDSEYTVKGKQVTTAKSFNVTAGEQIDMAAQAGFFAGDKGLMLTSPNGPAALYTSGGTASVSSETGTVALSSKGGSATLNAGKEIAAKAGNGFHVNGGPEIVVNGDEVHVKAGSAMMVMKDGKIYLNSGGAKTAKEPSAVVTSKPAQPVTPESNSTIA
jgi:hypothetical protein